MEQITISKKKVYSEDDINEIAKKMSNDIQEMNRLIEEKKVVNKKYKSQIDPLELIIDLNSLNIKNGYEFYDIKCNVVRDTKRKVKQYINVNTGEVEEEVPFVTEDFQTSIEDEL